MAADSAMTEVYPRTNAILKITPNVRKIYHVSKANLGISCWGLAKIQNKLILDFLAEFEESSIDKTDTIDEVAEKLKNHLQNVTPKIQLTMGLHLAGYVKKEKKYVSQLRHIFHERWHNSGDFTNENCHEEYHQNGTRIPFSSYFSYPTLFNGDNAIANCLFNYIPSVTGGRQMIRTESLTLDECLELAELVVGTSIQRLNYYVDPQLRRIPKTVAGKIFIAKITPANGFEWIKN